MFFVYMKKNKEAFYNVNYLTENALNEFINVSLKKRKSGLNVIKNDIFINKKVKKYKNIVIKLKDLNIKFNKMKTNISDKNLLWVEQEANKYLDSISKSIECINKFKLKSKYRSYKGKVIINEIAKSYVFLSLVKNNFDCVSHFRKIAKSYKLYKKEIYLLPILMKYYFINAFFDNLNELSILRKNIVKFSSMRDISKKLLLKEEVVYAVAKYNKHYTRLRLIYGINPLKSTYNIGEELLQKCYENRAVIMWLSVL